MLEVCVEKLTGTSLVGSGNTQEAGLREHERAAASLSGPSRSVASFAKSGRVHMTAVSKTGFSCNSRS